MRSDILQYFISHYNKESEIAFPEDFIIYDTTLRDGEQTPGVCSPSLNVVSYMRISFGNLISSSLLKGLTKYCTFFTSEYFK